MPGTSAEPRPPAAVRITTIFFFAAAGIAAITGFTLLFPGTSLDGIWNLNPPAYLGFARLGRTSGVMLWAVGVATGLSAVAMLSRKRWGWYFGLAVFAFNGLGDLIQLVLRGDVWKSGSGVLIAAAFLFWLTRPRVREFFRLSFFGRPVS